MKDHELYMRRCIALAKLGAGYVSPNPMVGAILVHENTIIGEGYHRQYGQLHAEVNCINSVKQENRHLIEKSVIYVSLEPCAHFGKTPPCADLIIKNKIPTVVIGCRDPFDKVDGKGIEKLKKAGITVINGILENECKELNKRFFSFYTKQRPYLILKWAQSKNQKISASDSSRVLISNDYTNRLVHKWRSEEAAILIGTNTALHDDPALNTRNWTGPDPTKLIIDLNLRLPENLQVFNRMQKTIVFNLIKHEDKQNLLYYKLDNQLPLVLNVLKACYELQVQSILVEGGARLLESFIREKVWDEARVIENSRLIIPSGLDAPILSNQLITASENISTDTITYYKNAIEG